VKFFNSYVDADHNTVDVLICDELHHIRANWNDRFWPQRKSGVTRVEEIFVQPTSPPYFSSTTSRSSDRTRSIRGRPSKHLYPAANDFADSRTAEASDSCQAQLHRVEAAEEEKVAWRKKFGSISILVQPTDIVAIITLGCFAGVRPDESCPHGMGDD
jgi:hypothetical protein